MEPMKYLYLLAADTARARAYLSILRSEGIRLDEALLVAVGDTPGRSRGGHPTPLFDNATPLRAALQLMDAPCISFQTADINSPAVCSTISELPPGIVIFAPGAGMIARKNLLEAGHKYLHVHPGRLPQYRGSTPMYYSIIEEKRLCATAIFLSASIDTGPVVGSMEFPFPDDLRSMDSVYDPYIRSVLLGRVLKAYLANQEIGALPQPTEGTTFHVIHPVLKHLALMLHR